MQVPMQVSFKDMSADPGLEQLCRAEADKLERFYDRITGCRIVLSKLHHPGKRGNQVVVSLDLSVPGKDIVVHRDPSADRELEKPERTVREAFDAARRQLEDHVRRVRGRVKAHEEPDHGRVRALDRLGGTGFIERPDGTEIYFNRASLVGVAWDDLDQGTEVRFAVEQDGSGLRACSVRLVGHNHPLS